MSESKKTIELNTNLFGSPLAAAVTKDLVLTLYSGEKTGVTGEDSVRLMFENLEDISFFVDKSQEKESILWKLGHKKGNLLHTWVNEKREKLFEDEAYSADDDDSPTFKYNEFETDYEKLDVSDIDSLVLFLDKWANKELYYRRFDVILYPKYTDDSCGDHIIIQRHDPESQDAIDFVFNTIDAWLRGYCYSVCVTNIIRDNSNRNETIEYVHLSLGCKRGIECLKEFLSDFDIVEEGEPIIFYGPQEIPLEEKITYLVHFNENQFEPLMC